MANEEGEGGKIGLEQQKEIRICRRGYQGYEEG